MMIRNRRFLWLAVLSCIAISSTAHGQWLEQTFELQAGWNSVYIEVDPTPHQADALFSGLPIEKVWLRESGSESGEAPESCGPDSGGPECSPFLDTRWRVWVPEGDQSRVAADLRTVLGNRVYMIKATEPAILTITGKPSAVPPQWRTGYNLVGFHVDPSSPPTIASYLSASHAHESARAFRKALNGEMIPVAGLDAEAITPGEGYWVKASASSNYDGPLRIDTLSLAGVDFGRKQSEHSLTIDNLSSSSPEISLAYESSAPAPVLDVPLVAGDVPLVWEHMDPDADEGDLFTWLSMVDSAYTGLFNPAGSPGSSHSIKLGVDRLRSGGLATVIEEDDGISSSYQGLLSVSDGAGFLRYLAVGAQVPPRHGLWIGQVSVTEVAWTKADAQTWANPEVITCGCVDGVCQSTVDGLNDGLVCTDDPGICDCPDPELLDPSDGDTTTLRPVASAFMFPIIMHLADDGTMKLLTEATMLFEPNGPDSSDGRYVLVTPACDNCDGLEDTETLRGQPFSPRVSTAAYSFDDSGDLEMGLSGDFGNPGSHLTAVIVLESDASVNPFKHRYHPDHDGDNVGECYKITRTMEMAFDSDPPPGSTAADYGFSLIAGRYLETITISARPDMSPACGCGDGQLCVGGANDGLPCVNVNDCPDGSCTATTVCVGGSQNDGEYCVDDSSCICPSPECFCDLDTGVCVGGETAGLSCYSDEHCSCGDERLYTTQAGGTFRLKRVSDISRLNDVSGN